MGLIDTITNWVQSLSGTTRPLWRDYSYWQQIVNFDIAKANGVRGMIARSTLGLTYRDPYFERNWTEAGRVDMYRSSYHVLYPGLSIPDQADNWYFAHPERDTIPRVIDLEISNSQPADKIATDTWDMSEIVLQRDGVRPIIYSRYMLINSWLTSWTDEMLNEHYWWLAQYLLDPTREHPGPPTLPNRVTRDHIVLHQTSDKLPGFPGEAQSASVDYDRWCIGDVAEMCSWIATNWGDGEPELPPMEDIHFDLPMREQIPAKLAGIKDKIMLPPVVLTGAADDGRIIFGNLPDNVIGLDLRIVAIGIEGARVHFGNGTSSVRKYRKGVFVAADGVPAEGGGCVLLDGNVLWRQHSAPLGSSVTYHLEIVGYLVRDEDEPPYEDDIEAILHRLTTSEREIEYLQGEVANRVPFAENITIMR